MVGVMEAQETRYASYEGVSVAYQVQGAGDIDIGVPGGPATHLDAALEVPGAAEILAAMGRFARVIRFDRRGMGLSDPVTGPPTLEQQIDDMIAVLDAVGVERVVPFGEGEGGRMCALFAATHPSRVSALVLYSPAARGTDVVTPELRRTLLDVIEQSWGRGDLARVWAPTRADDPEFTAAWARFERSTVSPSMARALVDMAGKTDVAEILPSIQAPTLVMHRRDDSMIPLRLGREVAGLIPGARFVELEGQDQLSFAGDWRAIVDEMEEFLTGHRTEPEPDRALMTVLFTDVVDSTRRAAELGDSAWRELLARHDRLVRRELVRERGRAVKSTGDGFLATFDGPARAIRCARAIAAGAPEIGLELRAGVHTGEVELVGDDIAGMAVHIAARVMAKAGPGEVLVSSTVKDLVVGSGLEFSDRGAHELKGVPGEWRLLAA
ncbi:MAG: hypothetical protein QOF37_949 [Thermoleophilaceae bacterium]|nr:hypothetical protein [Thermoleophilaceae bacterium]